MKKLITLMLLLIAIIGLFPKSVMAETTFEEQLTQYLNEVSVTRGLTITKEDLQFTLSLYEESLEDFNSVTELKDFLGEVINSDYSNLNTIYDLYELDQTGMESILAENGDSIDDYIYLEDLSYAIYFYTEGDVTQEPDFDTKLIEYLSYVSEIRGFQFIKDDLVELLDSYELLIEDFESVEELSDLLGDIIKSDLSNLSYFNENYDMDVQDILDLLSDNSLTIDNFIYMDELEEFIWTNSDLPSGLTDLFSEILPYLMSELGIDDLEMNQLVLHMSSLEEHMSDPIVEARFLSLIERVSTLSEMEITSNLTEDQINEIVSIYEEMLSLFKLKAAFYLIEDSVKTPLTLADLFTMTQLGNGVLGVSLYNTEGELLVDFTVSNDILESILSDLGGFVGNVEEEIIDMDDNKSPVVKQSTNNKTIKGGDLPDTATNAASMALVGVILMFSGAFLIWKGKMRQNDKNKTFI